MVDSIKITALQDIGANIMYTTLVPVVDMSGTPTTKKANLQTVGNLILNGAGGSYFPRAAQANLALSVANAAQPNITSVGTLTTLTVSGNLNASNVVANFYFGDGGFLTNVAGGGSNYSNSNVASYLPTYTGNVGANWILADYVSGNANPLTNIPGANVVGQVPYAAVANSVARANVSGLGNIAVINLDGNASNVLRGNGSWGPDANSSYGNTNVANYLPTYTGTVGANRISSNALSGSNVQINANGAVFTFGQGGAVYWPAPLGNIWSIEPNVDGEFEIKSTTNVVISTDISNANSHFTFDSNGIFTAPSNVNLLGTRLNIGAESPNISLQAPTIVIADSSNTFVQTALFNNDANGSADWVAYGEGGSDLEAWTDMGYAGHNFSDANYTITPPGDGYVFVQGYANGVGGNMVLATGNNGNSADIVFATGGFLSSNQFARIDHANNLFHLTRTGSAIKFQDGTTQNTAAVSNPFDQDLNTTDNVTFANITSTDAIRFNNLGNIVGALGYAPSFVSIEGYGSNSVGVTTNDVYTWTFNSIPVITLPSNQGYIGAGVDNQLRIYNDQNAGFMQLGWQDGAVLTPNSNLAANVTLNSSGVVITTTTDTYTTTNDWTFGTNGNLSVPGNISSSNSFRVGTANSYTYYSQTNGGTEVVATGNVWLYASSAQYNFNTSGTLQTQLPFSLESSGNINLGISANANSNVTIANTGMFVTNITSSGNVTANAGIKLNHTTTAQGEITISDGAANSFIVGVGNAQSTWAGAGSLNFITSSSPGANIGFFVAQSERGRFTTTGLTVTGNISATNIGNVAAVNLDGNVSNVLTGAGTFVALPVIDANTVVWTTAPVSNTSAGTAGQAAYDSGGNLFVCVATNTWAKFAGTTSW